MQWETLKKEIAKPKFFLNAVGLKATASIGHAFVAEVDRVVQELAEFYGGPSLAKKKGKVGGNPGAFLKFFDKFQGFLPKCATAVTL